jgi:hypothetical protein
MLCRDRFQSSLRLPAAWLVSSKPLEGLGHSVRVKQPGRPRRSPLRVGLVVGLLFAAFFAAVPWLGCITSLRAGIFAIPNLSPMWSVCTLGIGVRFNPIDIGLPGFSGPFWGSLIVGIAYVVGALYVAFTRRSL